MVNNSWRRRRGRRGWSSSKLKVNNCPMINKRNLRQLTLMRSLGAIWHDKRAVRVESTFLLGHAPRPSAPCCVCGSTNSLTCHESYWTCVCSSAKWWWRLVNDEAPNGENAQRAGVRGGRRTGEERERARIEIKPSVVCFRPAFNSFSTCAAY